MALGVLVVTTSCRVGYEALPSDLLDTGAVGSGASAAMTGGTPASGATGGSGNGATSAQGGDAGDGMGVGLGAQPAQGGADGGTPPDSGGEGGSLVAGGSGGTGTVTTCRTGTFDGHAYEHCDPPLTFAEAEADCDSRGLRLVKIETEEENSWVHSMIPAADQANNSTAVWRWLGGDDRATASDWRWSDGEAFWSGSNQGSPVGNAYNKWNTNQPLTNAHCVAMAARTGVWYAMNCMDARPYVCELY